MLRWLQSAKPNRYIVQIKQPLINPYLGLALEEYWFKELKFEDNKDVEKKLILLWRNQPSVVVGKFQNVWSECHTGFCRAHGIYVARRASGGGTVYHDPGNLNISIFSAHKHYNRKSNLEIVKQVLEAQLNFKGLEINERDDLLWHGKKISGTAAKLNQRRAYHHFTLLFNTDKHLLKNAITSPLRGWNLQTKATKSVPSPTSNLYTDADYTEGKISEFAVGLVRDGDEYLEVDNIADLGMDLSAISDELSSWDWIYGKTPKFVLNDKEVVKGRYSDGKQFYL